MDNITLNPLHDKIFICAPASGGSHLQPYINKVIAQWKQLNFNCVMPTDMFNDEQGLRHQDGEKWLYHHARTLEDNGKEDRGIWCANTAAIRTAHLQEALAREDIKLILCLKGGYGSGEVAYKLNELFKTLKLKINLPKAIITYSDGTFLLNYLTQHHAIIGVHGPMVMDLAGEDLTNTKLTQNMQQLYAFLAGQSMLVNLSPLNNSAKKNISITGILGGGNLTCICSTIGTVLQLNSKNKILILEDVNERGYKIVRNLLQMQQAGVFNQVKAIIFGTFTRGDQYTKAALIMAVEQIIDKEIPCFSTDQIGHIPMNIPFPIDRPAKVENGLLSYNSPFQLAAHKE